MGDPVVPERGPPGTTSARYDHHVLDVVEAIGDRTGGRLEVGGLLSPRPLARECPPVERRLIGVVASPLAARVAHVGLRQPQRVPVGGLGEAASVDAPRGATPTPPRRRRSDACCSLAVAPAPSGHVAARRRRQHARPGRDQGPHWREPPARAGASSHAGHQPHGPRSARRCRRHAPSRRPNRRRPYDGRVVGAAGPTAAMRLSTVSSCMVQACTLAGRGTSHIRAILVARAVCNARSGRSARLRDASDGAARQCPCS